MEYTRTGIILFTENYEACVDFYETVMELPVLHKLDTEHSKLACLDFGGGTYLMIETGGTSAPGGKPLAQNPVWIRFNVEDVEATAEQLSQKGVEIHVRKEVWGTLADFLDPDGNHCSLRDEVTFTGE